jgi:multicomponent Na+:H+ antiporter subunit D
MINNANFDFLLPILVVIPLIMAVVLFFIKNYNISYILTILTTGIVFSISIVIAILSKLNNVSYSFGNFMAPYGIEYKATALNLFFIIIVCFLGFIISIWQKKAVLLENKINSPYLFNALYLLFLTGSLGILITNDFFNLFVFLEILSLSTYILIALNKNKEAPLSAFNYLMIGTIAASFYVFGIGILYLIFGTLNIDDLINRIPQLPQNKLFYLASAFITAGIFIKMGLYPLFWWLPKSYQNASTSASAFIAGTSTKIAIYVFIKIVILMLGLSQQFNVSLILNILIILAIINMIYGGLLSLKQTDFKLLLAFSSISQLGYIILGIGIFNELSLNSTLYIILSHALVKSGLFLAIGMLTLKFNSNDINFFKGNVSKYPVLFFAIIYLSLSLAGFPLTSGFWGKLSLFFATLNSDFKYLTIFIIVSSLLSFSYAWKIIFSLWFNPNNLGGNIISNNKLPIYMYVALYSLICVDFSIAINPSFAFGFIEEVIQITFNLKG